MKTFYAIAELCLVVGKNDNFDETNEEEPVICRSLGLYKNIEDAEKKAEELNNDSDDKVYEVVSMNVK